jgi:hypothetical protein
LVAAATIKLVMAVLERQLEQSVVPTVARAVVVAAWASQEPTYLLEPQVLVMAAVQADRAWSILPGPKISIRIY